MNFGQELSRYLTEGQMNIAGGLQNIGQKHRIFIRKHTKKITVVRLSVNSFV